MHEFVQMVCALVKPTIMARKMVRASRGTDPRRPAEPRRAEHDREAERAHIVSGADKQREMRAIVLRTRLETSKTLSHKADGDLSEMPADETQNRPTRLHALETCLL